jgi:hypothetical protein
MISNDIEEESVGAVKIESNQIKSNSIRFKYAKFNEIESRAKETEWTKEITKDVE